jgi:hypothetical protein
MRRIRATVTTTDIFFFFLALQAKSSLGLGVLYYRVVENGYSGNR